MRASSIAWPLIWIAAAVIVWNLSRPGASQAEGRNVDGHTTRQGGEIHAADGKSEERRPENAVAKSAPRPFDVLGGGGGRVPSQALLSVGLTEADRSSLEEIIKRASDSFDQESMNHAAVEFSEGEPVVVIRADPPAWKNLLEKFRADLVSTFGQTTGARLFEGMNTNEYFGAFGTREVRIRRNTDLPMKPTREFPILREFYIVMETSGPGGPLPSKGSNFEKKYVQQRYGTKVVETLEAHRKKADD